ALVEYVNPKAEFLIDNFDDNSLDATKWTSFTAAGGSRAETNNEQEYTLAALTNGSWAGISSAKQFTIINSSIYVHYVSALLGND
ncbi:hypothetical protein, partial [Bacillus cereus group sp. BC329]|uniref:hypothetical protein n=1 Tax=Bacillus cereus group sp. BC329 TaxID=3445307 RepID=UPI003F255F54